MEKEGIIFGDLQNRRYICSEILTMYNLPKLPIGGIIRKKLNTMEEIRAFNLENKVLKAVLAIVRSESGALVRSAILKKGKSEMIDLEEVGAKIKDGEKVWLEVLGEENSTSSRPNSSSKPGNVIKRVSSKKFICRRDSPYRANFEVILNFRIPQKTKLPKLPVDPKYSLSFVGLERYFDDEIYHDLPVAQVDGIYYLLSASEEDGIVDRTATVTVNPSNYKGEVNIPENVDYEGKKYRVKGIDASAFDGSKELTKVNLPKTVEYIGFAAFAHSGLTSLEIPGSVMAIRSCTFSSCFNLQSVTIPSSVEEIGNFAYDECTSLKKIVIRRITPPSLEEDSFEGVDKSKITVYIPKGSMKYYHNRTWKDFNLVEG